MTSSGGRIQAVIFDYGGVLTTPGRAAISAWTRSERIRPETFSATLKEWLSRDAPPGTPIHRLETGELPVADFDRILAARLRTTDDQPVRAEGLLARLFSHMKSDPAMHDLVAELRENGIHTALLSNSWGDHYPWDQLDELFEVAVISSATGLRKPDPRIYELALERLGSPARNAVFVDDAAPNIDAADRVGLHTVAHEDAGRTRARLTELIPELRSTIEERR